MLVNNSSKIYIGETPITKVYNGIDIVYEKSNGQGYTELPYIESTGTQYINTLINPTTNHEVVIDYQFTDSNKALLFGSRYNWQLQGYMVCADNGTIGNSYYFQKGNQFRKSSTTNLSRHIMDFNVNNTNYISIDGTNVASFSNTTSFNAYAPIYLFSVYDGERASYGYINYGAYRLYSCKIYENSTLVGDFIPVLDSNDVACLYDKVSENYFYNGGTGDFVYPTPEPPPEPVPMPTGYTQLKNIIAHGHQRINTGIIPNDNSYGFEAKFCLENGESEGLWDWNIMNMGGNSVDNYRFGFGGWKGLGGNTNTPNLQPAGIRVSSGSKTVSNPKISYGTDYTVKFNYNNDKICYLDGISIASGFTNGSYTYSDPWNIFCQVYNNGATQYARFFWGKLYYLKIWLGETLVRNFVPALDNNNTPCLYDTVTQQTYYNSGTGSFTYEEL